MEMDIDLESMPFLEMNISHYKRQKYAFFLMAISPKDGLEEFKGRTVRKIPRNYDCETNCMFLFSLNMVLNKKTLGICFAFVCRYLNGV